jgi:oligosaccharide repeat unit polymerase
MGLISVVTKAGEAWRSVYDYGTMDVQYMATVNPAHHYGRVLLVIVACLIIRSMIKRNYKILTLQIVSVLPIVYEIFISGRRLSFAPTMLVVLLLLMYSSKIKNRKKIIVSLSGFFLVLFGIQFLLRAEYYEDAYGLDGINLVLRPLVGEFVSVGSSSINAFILITDDMKTYGLHFLTSFLDALPYVKLGGVFSSFFNVKIWDDYLSIAPWGGFSMMADAYLSFGLLGYAVFSVLAAFFLAQSHLYFKYLCDAGVVINRYSIFYFGFIALVILQYRVGIVDSARTLVAFVSLYLFAVVFPVYVKQWLRSRVVFMKSVPE